jgi:3-hydroxyisobutyrate dehydrogenase-like beta-hydroxyacid dehydrogenase
VDLLQGGLARTEVLQQKGDNWVHETFDDGGSAVNQLKDLRFAAEAASARSLRLPTTDRVTELFEWMVSEGHGHLDHTGLYLTLSHLASRVPKQSS